ncbi:FecR domain-containing protein [Cronbergia sp. UHCC 0137]|uniref:FecR family protein n=1 Tax=Cronbergia sp. UHCC 0137 TaxID=3110239 RepID=UPI002B217BED|nr:FecR domain-containing protein [Cronbergia sp. UHCC 0137]MEA5616826.1 FecR domain-containing protein [Cronbergia sp. UHCC 0137]
MKNLWTCNLTLLLVGLVSTLQASAANNQLQVKVNRWIEVRRAVGQVRYLRGQTSKPASRGMRLQAVGEGISTGRGSSAVLAIDVGTGFINISENTQLIISKLQTGRGGARITELQVKNGQVRLQIRPLTNSSSRIEIHTPAGVAGVRGTLFGVSVKESGITGVATKEGGVATIAQGKTILVNANYQNLTIPGEPPSDPVPLREDTRLNISELVANGSQVRIVGTVDSVNLLMIAKQQQKIDFRGKFDVTVPLPPNRKVEAVVVTPLGRKQLYQLAVP